MSGSVLSELCLRSTIMKDSKLVYTFMLRNPKQLTAYEVQSVHLIFHGQAWYVTCQRNASFLSVHLTWQANSISTKCRLNFSFALINRKTGNAEIADEKSAWFSNKEKLHGFDRIAKLNYILDSRMGFRSTLSEWLEIELTVQNCTIRSCVEVPYPFSGTAHVSTDVIRLGAFQVQLQFYPKGKATTKHEGKPCFYLFTPQIEPQAKFQIQYECSIEQDDVRYTTGKKSCILTCKTVKEHLVPAQQIARFGTSPTFCLDVTSVSTVSDLYLRLSRDMNTIRATTFEDGEGGEWKVKFLSGERAGLTLCLAPSIGCHQTDMTVLHWKGAFVPKRSKQEPLPLNDDKVMCATTACQDSHVTEFRMDTSLSTTQFITNQYLFNKRLLLRVEILKIQHGVLMPQPHDVMINLGLRGATQLVDKVQHLEEENARLLLEYQELKTDYNSLLQNKPQAAEQCTQVNDEDFRRPSSTSSQPSNPNSFVTEAQLDYLAGNLGHNWKRLAINLNFKMNDIEQIEEETSFARDRIFNMLYKWKRRTRRGSTVGKLVEALKSVDEDYDAYRFLLDS